MTRIAGLVLAAGASRRMGRPKALLTYRRHPNDPGQTFVDAALDYLSGAGLSPLLVVLGHDPPAILAGARLDGAQVVVNNDYDRGQFSSLQEGVRFLADPRRTEEGGGEGIAAAVVALTDQPHIPVAVVTALVARFEQTGAPIVRPLFQGRGGHPILLGAETFGELLALPATATLYELVGRYSSRREDVEVSYRAVVEDFDVPGDLSRLP